MAVSLKNIKSLLNKKKQPSTNTQEETKQEEAKVDYAEVFIKSMKTCDEGRPSFNLEEFKVPNTNNAYYVKNYISQEQE